MNLAPQPHDLSNRYRYPWVLVIVILVMWLWPAAEEAFGIYADALPVATLLVGLSAAAKYSIRCGLRRRFAAA